MYTLEVDFDVYKAIFSRRANEHVTENDVLRDLLRLPEKQGASAAPMVTVGAQPTAHTGDWVVKNIRFPTGTEFRAVYKGKTYTGRIQEGALVVDGKSFDSPSAAAVAITGNSVNGWRFWECRFPGKSSWQLIESLRH